MRGYVADALASSEAFNISIRKRHLIIGLPTTICHREVIHYTHLTLSRLSCRPLEGTGRASVEEEAAEGTACVQAIVC